MRKIGFSIAATILTWILFAVCAYVLLTAPQLRYLIEADRPLDWPSRDYRDLGLFLGVVTFFLFCIACLNTYFLISHIRINVSVVKVHDDNFNEKPKHQPENHVSSVPESLDEGDRAELRDIIATQEDQQFLQHRR